MDPPARTPSGTDESRGREALRRIAEQLEQLTPADVSGDVQPPVGGHINDDGDRLAV